MQKQRAHTDTSAWIFQVWLSFFLAASVTFFGLYHLPVMLWIKGYAVMGLFFMIGSTFTLAKTIRDNRYQQVDTSAWILQVWIAFAIAILLMGIGIYYLPVNLWIRGYVAIGAFFVLAASFTLAKTIRDNDESTQDKEIASAGHASSDHNELAELGFIN
jgi:hypothetical protein